jgi:hypothetical protein
LEQGRPLVPRPVELPPSPHYASLLPREWTGSLPHRVASGAPCSDGTPDPVDHLPPLRRRQHLGRRRRHGARADLIFAPSALARRRPRARSDRTRASPDLLPRHPLPPLYSSPVDRGTGQRN